MNTTLNTLRGARFSVKNSGAALWSWVAAYITATCPIPECGGEIAFSSVFMGTVGTVHEGVSSDKKLYSPADHPLNDEWNQNPPPSGYCTHCGVHVRLTETLVDKAKPLAAAWMKTELLEKAA